MIVKLIILQLFGETLREKDSPTDKGRAIFLKLLENTHYIGDDMTGIK